MNGYRYLKSAGLFNSARQSGQIAASGVTCEETSPWASLVAIENRFVGDLLQPVTSHDTNTINGGGRNSPVP